MQHLGLGSVAYVFVLAFVLWLLAKPLGPQNWTYRSVLTFVTLTSPPALLYAIPVERFLDLETARLINVWVSRVRSRLAGRVAGLLFETLGSLALAERCGRRPLPITIVVTVLTALNLERAVFDVMGGLREEGTAGDSAYGVLIALTLLSTILVGPLLLAYGLISFFNSRSPSSNRR